MRLKQRVLSLLLTSCLIVGMLPQTAFATEGPTIGTSGLCEHHTEHDESCGYMAGTEEIPCTHEHTEDCSEEITSCVHEHDESCYPADIVSDNDATPSDAAEPTECAHECNEESGCVTEELNCQHEHDSECGYIAAAEGHDCHYECGSCAAPVCTCETDDPASHRTDCPAYTAPENPECYCWEKCITETLNVWCDVCGVQGVDACEGEGEAALAAASDYNYILIGSQSPWAESTLKVTTATGGTAEWDADTNTLTLDNVDFSDSNVSLHGACYGIVIEASDSSKIVTINVKGTNTIGTEQLPTKQTGIYTNCNLVLDIDEGASLNIYAVRDEVSDSWPIAIYVPANLTIKGGGTLTANSTDNACIWSNTNIEVLGSVKVNATTNAQNCGMAGIAGVTIGDNADVDISSNSTGLYSEGDILISNESTVNVNSQYGIWTNGGTLTISGGTTTVYGSDTSIYNKPTLENYTPIIHSGESAETATVVTPNENPNYYLNKYVRIEPGYSVSVTNGTGSGVYPKGAPIKIKANDPESNKQFKEWSGADGLTFTEGNKTSAEATFTMPANAVNVTATYEDVVLTGIVITAPPSKTVYTEGETFDPAGMVLKASYSNGTSKEVTGYTFSPNVALTTSDASVTVRYTEGNVTKTATQNITVSESHDHTYVYKYTGDIGHWQECNDTSCPDADKGKTTTEAHDFTSNTDTVCDDCGYTRTVHIHSYGTVWKSDSSGHWHECSCGDKADFAAHSFNNACDTDCNDGCGYTRSITHSYGSEWSKDASGHWHECSCGDKADYAAHTPGASATSTTPQTCTVCGYIIKAATGGGTGGGYTPPDDPDDGGDSGDEDTPSAITIPVSGDGATIHVKVTISGTTATIEEIDPAELEKVIGGDVATGIVKIDLSGLNRDIDRVNLPVSSIEDIVEAAEHAHNDTEALAILFPHGTVQWNDKTMRAIVEQAECNTVRLVLDDTGTTRLNSAQKEAIADLDVYGGVEAYLMCVKANKRISDFEGGVATLSIPFTIPNGLEAAAFTVWYIDDNGSKEQLKTWHEGNRLYWDVGHFSDFVIAYDESKPNPNTGAEHNPNTGACPSAPYIDVDTSLWYHDAIDFAIKFGLMVGTNAAKTTFEPNTTTSRAMIVAILHRLEGEPTADKANTFTDVPDAQWYTDAVLWAAEHEIAVGYDGKFNPNDPITREQIAAILYRYAKYKGYDVSAKLELANFADADKVSTWATEAMRWACGAEIIVGIDNAEGTRNLEPKRGTKRSEAAAIFQRFCKDMTQ